MKRIKRALSLLLSLIMLGTAIASTGMISYASSNISPMSLLPLEEKTVYLILNNESNEQLKEMTISTVLGKLQESNGNLVSIDKNATTVWHCYKDSESGLESYEAYLIDDSDGKKIDLSQPLDANMQTIELIVGRDGQLNNKNIRYIVKVYYTGYNNNVSYELYSQSVDGSKRTKIEPLKKTYSNGSYDEIVDINGNPVPMYNAVYSVPEGQILNPYLGIRCSIEERPDVSVDFYELTDNQLTNPITDQLLNQDMTKPNSGYKMTGTGASFILKFNIDGIDAGIQVFTFTIAGSFPYVSSELFEISSGSKTSVTYASTEDIDFDDDIYTIQHELKNGKKDAGEYYLNFYANNGENDISDKVVKAVVGHYNSLSEASNAPDIKADLFSTSTGYKANYSGNGVNFTLFFEDGVIYDNIPYKLTVKAVEYATNMREYTDKPIIGEADPWFRVTGATDNQGKSYDTYVIENGKSINMDTYYGYGYQTLFINDANADLTQLKPNFWYANTDRVYAVSKDTGAKVEENHVRDFSNENQQYTGVIIDNGKENNRNYWVTFKKLNNNGPELYVFGPNEREVILDEYFEYKHDVLIANIGNAPLEGLSVELKDAENVKLDPYWTVGGTNNDTLAPFTATLSNTKYGEIANIAKVRLLPDGDGEVKGTLIIKAKGQEPVLIELNGTAQQPKIVTETLSDAVKYVPYAHIVVTDNIHSWNDVTFELISGKLPDGVELNTQTGEIYGTPQEAGEFHFTVEAKYTYFEPTQQPLTLNVKDNTNENVFQASDEEYAILDSIGEDVNGDHNYVLKETGDQVFRSNGEFADFVDFWLNGEKLVEGVDYDVSEGSTRITIRSQTFENKANQDGSNTIAAEFRTNGGDPNGTHEGELKRTAQNFTMDVQKSDPAVDNVIALINAIPDTVKLSDKATVEKARTAYNALTEAQKNQVTNYDRLTAAEKDIATLEENECRDKAAANTVIAMIDSLPSTITLNDRTAVNNARSAYENLTAQQKAYVTNLNKLVNAENRLKELENEDYQSNQYVTFIGRIVDSNGKPMVNVIVELHSKVQTARTDSNGFFRFNMVEMGKHSLIVKDANGKVIASKDFSIVEGTPLSVTEDIITAENRSTFTVTVEAKGSNLTFKDLQEGDHTVAGGGSSDEPGININDSQGSVSSPQTGDSTNLALWYTLLILSLSGLVIMAVLGRRRISY